MTDLNSLAAGIIGVYFGGVFISSYLWGRFDSEPKLADDPFWPIVLWPALLAMAALLSPIAISLWLAELGERHRKAARARAGGE